MTHHFLARIEDLNPRLHAFNAIDAEGALARARALEAGPRPSISEAPLWGLPYGDKDILDRAGLATTHGTVGEAPKVARETSRLGQMMDAAGGISLGKTNTPEFAFSGYGENKLPSGSARNPWDTRRDPGGSSSGAAVAVAGRMLPFAPGNDGGGSIRIPASACGVIGLKPSRGRVPESSGIDSLGGLPVGGPLARTVADAALLLDGMCRGDHRFTLRAPEGPASFLEASATDPGRLRIGWNTWSPWARHMSIECTPGVNEALEDTVRRIEGLGHRVSGAPVRPFAAFKEAFTTVWMAGAAGLPITDDDLEGYEALTRWLVRGGRSLSAGQLAAALASFSAFEAQIIEDYAPFDAVVTPTLTSPAPMLGTFDAQDGEHNFAQQCQFAPFTSYVNVCGLPAISLPVGEEKTSDGTLLPVGVQLVGRPGGEALLLQLAGQLERVIGWDERRPPEHPLHVGS